MLPFTTEEFFEVFARYNAAIWPAQIGAAALGLFALILLFVIPLAWSAIGGSAAVLLAVPQDYGLILAGAIAAILRVGQRVQPSIP